MGFFDLLKECSCDGGGFTGSEATRKKFSKLSKQPIDYEKAKKDWKDGNIIEALSEYTGVAAEVRYEMNSRYKDTKQTVYLDYFGCEGAIIFCELAIGLEHSGVYIGNREIVELNGDGRIRKIDPVTFHSGSELRTGYELYTFTDLNGNILCSKEIAERALDKIGTKVTYNIVFNNCHEFSTGCITGNFLNFNMTFDSLLSAIARKYGAYEIRKIEL